MSKEVFKSGFIAIIGRPNVGKSSLLNSLLKEERAIVTAVPGTTRDTIEDTIVIDGIDYRFIDTAGLRDTTDIIEIMGIKKTHEKINQAEVVMLIDELEDTPEEIILRIKALRELMGGSGKRLFILINKIDLGNRARIEFMKQEIELAPGEELLFISARAKTGLEELRTVLSGVIAKERLSSDEVIITNIRHYEALSRISESLLRIEEGLENNLPEDLIAIDIRQAIHYLGEITGEITTDELLGNIFRNFCIGK